jgi:hypothetical protein
VAVIARANPIVKVLVFKHSENKLYHIYNLNACPSLANPDSLDSNPEQSYLDLPSEVKLSQDALFMTIITYNGEIKVVKMPPIINPTREDEPVANIPAPVATGPPGKGQPAPA